MNAYHRPVLDALARHGLRPRPDTPPARLRGQVNDLYRYELRRLRDALLGGRIPKADYAGLVVETRKRYWLLSVPVAAWTVTPEPPSRP